MKPKLKEKRWNKNLEKIMRKIWEKEKIYKFHLGKRKIFSIDTPPPYPRLIKPNSLIAEMGGLGILELQHIIHK